MVVTLFDNDYGQDGSSSKGSTMIEIFTVVAVGLVVVVIVVVVGVVVVVVVVRCDDNTRTSQGPVKARNLTGDPNSKNRVPSSMSSI